ncbi:3471_t:CDS:2 [Paraglomus brasilianum]|uniref:3471_t:CDS:1 n=1 Tax=Paraglomus brasilianum TaxID=144538 RepID=A0A9N8ZWF2_9GLOM|nr:3471_t:CDS:2 [Paraglomus brasilianum]
MGDLVPSRLIIDDHDEVKRYHHHRYGHIPYTPRPFESKIPMHLRTQPPERTLFNYWRLLDIVFVFTFIGIWWHIDRKKGIEISENGNGGKNHERRSKVERIGDVLIRVLSSVIESRLASVVGLKKEDIVTSARDFVDSLKAFFVLIYSTFKWYGYHKKKRNQDDEYVGELITFLQAEVSGKTKYRVHEAWLDFDLRNRQLSQDVRQRVWDRAVRFMESEVWWLRKFKKGKVTIWGDSRVGQPT